MKIIDFFLKRKLERTGLLTSLPNPPSIQVPDRSFQDGFKNLYKELYSNLMPPLGRHSDVWARPAPKFPAAYLWDSAFISQAWKAWDPSIALRILRPFVDFQAPDGRMPHMIFLGRHVSKLSNPPFLSWAVLSILKWSNDKNLADFFAMPLIEFARWRMENRLDKEHGLYFWIDNYESGIDNTPRFRSTDEKEDYGVHEIGAVDLNSEIALQLNTLEELLNITSGDIKSDFIRREKDRIEAAINKKLWNEDDGYFCDLDLRSGDLIPIDTIASYFPACIKSLPEKRVERLITHLSNPKKYNTRIPFPTVSKDSPFFMKDMWRGPTWVNTTYFLIKSLQFHEKDRFACNAAYRACKGVFDTWRKSGSFFEFYDPDRADLLELTRKKGNLYKQITLGSKPVKYFAGWTADINALVIECIFGLNRDESGWHFNPHFPEEWLKRGNLLKIRLPFYKLSLEVKVDKELECSMMVGEVKHVFSIENHDAISI
ncbi:MAG: MGH1-like glycoside hydrolase domain-containing protein [Promethearchaeota archaeon]